MKPRVHPTADVHDGALIGENTLIWHQAQVRENAKIGYRCVIGKGVYVDKNVVIGNCVKIQNYVSLYDGVTLEDGVFCGPHCVFTNDKRPRAVNVLGSPLADDQWEVVPTLVKKGASIGANATIVCGITIGKWAMVAAGAVVCCDVPDFCEVRGNPAAIQGFVCRCGERIANFSKRFDVVDLHCTTCGMVVTIDTNEWEKLR